MVEIITSSEIHHFQGKDPDEQFQFYFRQHWIRLLWPFCRTILWSILLFVLGYFVFVRFGIPDPVLRHATIIGFGIMFFFVQWGFLLRFYIYFLYVIVVTDRKVHRIKKTLFSVDDHQSLDIWSFQDIHKTQHGIIQNIFGYGSLTLESQDTELRIHFVPRIADIYGKMLHLREMGRVVKPGS